MGDDKTARLWEASSGRPIGTPIAHQVGITSVAYSPDGKTVLTGSVDRSARLWDASSGRPIGAPMEQQGPVTSVAYSPDGKTVLTGSNDKTARVWDASSGRPVSAPMEHQAEVRSVAYSPDGKTVLIGSGNTARLWKVGFMEGDVDRIVAWIELVTGEVMEPLVAPSRASIPPPGNFAAGNSPGSMERSGIRPHRQSKRFALNRSSLNRSIRSFGNKLVTALATSALCHYNMSGERRYQ